jgi:hypothetical protein
MPTIMYAASDNGNERDKPNTIVATPNTSTATSSARPARTIGLRSISAIAITSAPASSEEVRAP